MNDKEHSITRKLLNPRGWERCLRQASESISALCDFDLYYPSCCETVGIYCNLCLLGLARIHQMFFEISHHRIGFLWPWRLTSWSPNLTVSCRFPVVHLCQFASKLVHSFSQYKFGKRRVNRRMDERTDSTEEQYVSAYQSGLEEAWKLMKMTINK